MMSQLLKITTTPIKIAVNVEQGHYEEVEQKNAVKHKIQRQQRVQALQSQQQLKTATSTYKPTAKQIEAAERVDSYQSTQTISATIPVEFATINNLMNMRVANSQNQLTTDNVQSATTVKQNYVTNPNSNTVAYVPNSSDDIKWEPSTLNLDFEFNFNTVEENDTKLKYVPRQISFEVEQYPTIKIEYLGGPMYVPPSSDPNYEDDKNK